MTPERRKRPTQREVAELAGVSQAAVSQVLNGRGGGVRIPETTRQKVLQAMREVGYVPNVAARRLAGGQNRILGVFTYEPVFPSGSRDFFAPFLEGIEEAAADLDYDLLLHTRPAAGGGARPLYRDGTSRLRLADGTVMLGQVDGASRADLARLLGEGHPVVFIGRREVPGFELPHVTADYAAATGHALGQLLAHGHRRTLYLGAPLVHESAADRERGYREAVEGTGTVGAVVRPDEVTPALVAGHLAAGVTGVLFENEVLAAAWVGAAASLGHRWPASYSFAVLGDPIAQGELPPGWAHSRIPRPPMGRAAVRMLAALLAGETSRPITLPCEWVEGASMGPPPHSGPELPTKKENPR
ncbi:LacI family DNA-binding transcriptional regulator [Deinococcus sp. YIM 134068]|uniref:LacI family DNA-binding transcriptional regulator n=1 Tax=Deinococcus lichenicola TaxID=3118910 RepID=UPI002F9551A8